MRLSAMLVVVTLLASTASAQWSYRDPNAPRTADGRVDVKAPPPRTASGTLDLSGIWQTDIKYNANLAADLKAGEVVMTPWGQALFDERQDNNGKDDPEGFCLQPGVPRVNGVPFPQKIIQTPTAIVILYETRTTFRQIFLGGHTLGRIRSRPGWGTRRADGRATRWSSRPPASTNERGWTMSVIRSRSREGDRADPSSVIRSAARGHHDRRSEGVREAMERDAGVPVDRRWGIDRVHLQREQPRASAPGGEVIDHAMVPPSVQRIDKFDVLRRLGRGGMGSVYLARDPDIDRLVAIKLLNEGFDEEDLRGRFSAEARSASALRHPNVVTIFQTGTFLGRPFIVMEYVAGETFADIIASRRPVPIGEKLGWLDQLLAGLHYAHTKGVVHRDIKPSNVMVDPEGGVRILDFGIARLGDGGLTQTGTLLGTLNYIAPEQLAGKPVDARADIFAAGLVAYELLASKRAFPQEFPEIVTQIGFHDPPPLEEACPGIDPRLVAIVGRCLAKQADDRYADCAAVRRDLDAVRKSPSVPEAVQHRGSADCAGAIAGGGGDAGASAYDCDPTPSEHAVSRRDT